MATKKKAAKHMTVSHKIKNTKKKTAKKTTAKKKAATTSKPKAKAAPKKSPPKEPAVPSKPIRFDYLMEKLHEEHGQLADFPSLEDNLDLLLFAHLALQMKIEDAKKAFGGFKTQFVDWNDVRISDVSEVQEVLKGAYDPRSLASFLQDFLNRLFLEQHHVGLEFLRNLTNPEIKAFFKNYAGFADSTMGLVLERINEYPVIPLENVAMPFLERIGLGAPDTTALQRQKDLYEKVSRDQVVLLSLFLNQQARYTCPMSEGDLDCPDCVLKRGCPYPAKVTPRQRAAAKKSVKKSK